MSNKGFTLIELLGVLALLAIITLISIPIVLNTINRSNKKVDDATKELLKNSADLYLDDMNVELLNNQEYIVPVSQLINYNLIKKEMLTKGFNESSTIVVSLNNGVKSYEFHGVEEDSGGIKYICERASELSTPGVGSVGSENPFTFGEEYLCNPGDSRLRRFYVVYNESDTYIYLISAINIGGNIIAGDANDYYNFVLQNWDPTIKENYYNHGTIERIMDFVQAQSIPVSEQDIFITNTNCVTGLCTEKINGDVMGAYNKVTKGYYDGLSSMQIDYSSSNVVNGVKGVVTNSEQFVYGVRPIIKVPKHKIKTVAN